jgi:hypothetical protein
MADPDNNEAKKDKLNRLLEESLSRGRISKAEADVIRRFFQSKTARKWPMTDLQRRMQSSGG